MKISHINKYYIIFILLGFLFSCKPNHKVVLHPCCVEKSQKALVGYCKLQAKKSGIKHIPLIIAKLIGFDV